MQIPDIVVSIQLVINRIAKYVEELNDEDINAEFAHIYLGYSPSIKYLDKLLTYESELKNNC